MTLLRLVFVYLVLCLVPVMAALATEMKPAKPTPPGASGLAIPRFVSLASGTVHMRAGPGVRYPITWIYKRLGTPVMVMAEHDFWRKVRDAEGTEGWMHRSLLSGRRTAVLRGKVADLRQLPNMKAPVILQAEPGVIGKLLKCKKFWCQMELGDTRAWIRRSAIFGTLATEQY